MLIDGDRLDRIFFSFFPSCRKNIQQKKQKAHKKVVNMVNVNKTTGLKAAVIKAWTVENIHDLNRLRRSPGVMGLTGPKDLISDTQIEKILEACPEADRWQARVSSSAGGGRFDYYIALTSLISQL
jgi:hypothetical protein